MGLKSDLTLQHQAKIPNALQLVHKVLGAPGKPFSTDDRLYFEHRSGPRFREGTMRSRKFTISRGRGTVRLTLCQATNIYERTNIEAPK